MHAVVAVGAADCLGCTRVFPAHAPGSLLALTCLQVRILSFGVMLFLPMTIAAMAVLLPVNYTSGACPAAEPSRPHLPWPSGHTGVRQQRRFSGCSLPALQCAPDYDCRVKISHICSELDTGLPPCPADNYKLSAEEDGISDPYTSVFMRMTISNIRQGSPLLWCAASQRRSRHLRPAAVPPTHARTSLGCLPRPLPAEALIVYHCCPSSTLAAAPQGALRLLHLQHAVVLLAHRRVLQGALPCRPPSWLMRRWANGLMGGPVALQGAPRCHPASQRVTLWHCTVRCTATLPAVACFP